MRVGASVVALLTLACASGSTTVLRGHYGLQLDSTNAAAVASMNGADDLDVTLRAAFAQRFEDVDYAPRLAATSDYDALIFVRLNYQRVTGSRNPTEDPPKRIGLEYDIASEGATFASGFVPLNVREWPPVHMTSEQVYAALSSASQELASRVAQDIARSRKSVPGKPNPTRALSGRVPSA